MDDMRKGKPHSMKGEEMVVKVRTPVVSFTDTRKVPCPECVINKMLHCKFLLFGIFCKYLNT